MYTMYAHDIMHVLYSFIGNSTTNVAVCLAVCVCVCVCVCVHAHGVGRPEHRHVSQEKSL